MTLRNGLAHTFTYISTHILAKRMTLNKQKNQHNFRIFNSHPREEDDIVSFAVCEEQRFFNSHPHEEDDVVVHGSTERIRFSTHILTRRMTKLHTIINSYRLFSTHILTRRMTFTTRNAFDYFTFFNSHPHEENDANTSASFLSPRFFNSHPHEENDDARAIELEWDAIFQLTSSRGE